MPSLESPNQNKNESPKQQEGVSPRVAELLKKADEGYARGLEKRATKEQQDKIRAALADVDMSFEVEELRRAGYSREEARRIRLMEKAEISYDRAIEHSREKELNERLLKEAQDKRNQLLEGRGIFKMSKEDFQTYFAPEKFEVGAKMSQGNVGDCYAVAGLHALSRSPHYEMFVRSSMRRREDGTWEVSIPLLSQDGEVVSISPEEIQPQENPNYVKWTNFLGPLASGLRIYAKLFGKKFDTRDSLRPLEGKEGLKVLEAAYIKSSFGTVDRLSAEGGRSSDFLRTICGENVRWLNLNAARFDDKKKIRLEPPLSELDKLNSKILDNFLGNYDPEVFIATAAVRGLDRRSLGDVGANLSGFFMVEGTNQLLAPNHAYSISAVDSKDRMISLVNPWDTSKPIKLTFDQFKRSFHQLGAIRIDSSKILQNMKSVVKEVV